MNTRSLLVAGCCLAVLARPARANDWPTFRGADRTGVSQETGLLKAWPRGGPKLLWTYDKGGIGFSGPAVVGSTLYFMGARKDAGGKETEELIALDTAKGTELWSVPVGPMFRQTSYGDGPRGTPTVDGDHIYALGGQGELVCVGVKDHAVIWKKSFLKDFGGKFMNIWGYSESPLVDGDKLIVSPGGKDGAILALNKADGKLLWRCKELPEDATYGSLVIAALGGVRQYVGVTFISPGEGGRIVGVAAKDGKLLWSFKPKPQFDDTAVCSTPIIDKNMVYLSASKSGCHLVQITGGAGKAFKAKELYTKTATRRVMVNYHGGVIRVGDYVYGFSDRGTSWVCQKIATGAEAWKSKKLGKGSLTCAGGQLYLYSEDEGEAVLIDAVPTGWKEHGRFSIPRKSKVPMTHKGNSAAKIWTHPVVANGRLYLRDQELLYCYDVSAKK